jgi:hypothetical protein
MPRLALLLIFVAAVAACYKDNLASCELPTNAGKSGCPDAGQKGCAADFDCKALQLTPACDTVKKECVACTVDNLTTCGSNTPRCENDTCVACFDDNDCTAGQGTARGTGICLPSGACAAPPFLRVSPTGVTTGDCMSTPCSLERALTLAKASSNATLIKADTAGTYLPAGNQGFVVDSDSNQGITLDLSGAVLNQRQMDVPILTIGTAKPLTVTVLGGKIDGAMGAMGDGIRCNANATLTVRGSTITNNGGVGIRTNTCVFTLGQSTIGGAGAGNKAGGIAVTDGTFVIVGNVIIDNTGKASVRLTTSTSGNRFDFNTIANNSAPMNSSTGGVDCDATLTAAYNIIWNNTVVNNATAPQVVNPCMHNYSSIGPLPITGMGNIMTDPMLTPDGHLQATTLKIPTTKTVDVSGIAERDIDHDKRVVPIDMGADQIAPPK